MTPGLNYCIVCEVFLSSDERVNHKCKTKIGMRAERLDFIHCLFQELQDQGFNLPMGDYNLVYEILEDTRNYITISEELILLKDGEL